MKEQTLVDYLNEHKFESVMVAATEQRIDLRDKVIALVKETLGVDPVPANMELSKEEAGPFTPTYKVTHLDGSGARTAIFTTDLTIGIIDDHATVYRVGNKYPTVIGNRLVI